MPDRIGNQQNESSVSSFGKSRYLYRQRKPYLAVSACLKEEFFQQVLIGFRDLFWLSLG